jgi:enoyl-CoA hydratase/carnithine racemase
MAASGWSRSTGRRRATRSIRRWRGFSTRRCWNSRRTPDVDVAVLTGAGGAFCAGFDLKAAASGAAEDWITGLDIPENWRDPVGQPLASPMGPARLMLSKPVIAAIEGPAVAGGLELALWCDLRVVAEGAQLGVFCRRWGVPLIDGGTVRLPLVVGQGRANDLILTGRPVDAAEAQAMGLADRVVATGAGARRGAGAGRKPDALPAGLPARRSPLGPPAARGTRAPPAPRMGERRRGARRGRRRCRALRRRPRPRRPFRRYLTGAAAQA